MTSQNTKSVLPHSSPDDMEVDPQVERGFRRGYVNGLYDALIGVKERLSDDEFRLLEEWISGVLVPWSNTGLSTAIRPPEPTDPALRSTRRTHGDGPFSLPSR